MLFFTETKTSKKKLHGYFIQSFTKSTVHNFINMLHMLPIELFTDVIRPMLSEPDIANCTSVSHHMHTKCTEGGVKWADDTYIVYIFESKNISVFNWWTNRTFVIRCCVANGLVAAPDGLKRTKLLQATVYLPVINTPSDVNMQSDRWREFLNSFIGYIGTLNLFRVQRHRSKEWNNLQLLNNRRFNRVRISSDTEVTPARHWTISADAFEAYDGDFDYACPSLFNEMMLMINERCTQLSVDYELTPDSLTVSNLTLTSYDQSYDITSNEDATIEYASVSRGLLNCVIADFFSEHDSTGGSFISSVRFLDRHSYSPHVLLQQFRAHP